MPTRIAIPDLVSPSYFPAIAAVELGFCAAEGLDATIELRFPVTETYAALRDGEFDYVGGAAHAVLYAFPGWSGASLVCAISQHMYWYLVVRADLDAVSDDLDAVRGLHIGAAPGPVDGLRRLLRAAGIDPDRDVDLGPVPGVAGGGVSFGVTAAEALASGRLDGFWANGMGAEVAIRAGTGKLLLDARRGGGHPAAQDYTFPAMVATDHRLTERPDEVGAMVRALTAAQRALAADPDLATEAARPHFPDYETSLIADIIRRDAPYYSPVIPRDKVQAMNAFAHELGLLADAAVPYEQVVAPVSGIDADWHRGGVGERP